MDKVGKCKCGKTAFRYRVCRYCLTPQQRKKCLCTTCERELAQVGVSCAQCIKHPQMAKEAHAAMDVEETTVTDERPRKKQKVGHTPHYDEEVQRLKAWWEEREAAAETERQQLKAARRRVDAKSLKLWAECENTRDANRKYKEEMQQKLAGLSNSNDTLVRSNRSLRACQRKLKQEKIQLELKLDKDSSILTIKERNKKIRELTKVNTLLKESNDNLREQHSKVQTKRYELNLRFNNDENVCADDEIQREEILASTQKTSTKTQELKMCFDTEIEMETAAEAFRKINTRAEERTMKLESEVAEHSRTKKRKREVETEMLEIQAELEVERNQHTRSKQRMQKENQSLARFKRTLERSNKGLCEDQTRLKKKCNEIALQRDADQKKSRDATAAAAAAAKELEEKLRMATDTQEAYRIRMQKRKRKIVAKFNELEGQLQAEKKKFKTASEQCQQLEKQVQEQKTHTLAMDCKHQAETARLEMEVEKTRIVREKAYQMQQKARDQILKAQKESEEAQMGHARLLTNMTTMATWDVIRRKKEMSHKNTEMELHKKKMELKTFRTTLEMVSAQQKKRMKQVDALLRTVSV